MNNPRGMQADEGQDNPEYSPHPVRRVRRSAAYTMVQDGEGRRPAMSSPPLYDREIAHKGDKAPSRRDSAGTSI
jgi:hypothetical protein